MEAIIIESGIAGSVTRVELRAASFPDQRILRMIIDGLASDGTLFELTRDGEPCGALHSREPGKRNEEMMSDDNGQALPRVFSLIRASKVDQVTSQATQCDIVSNACRSLALGDPHFLDEPLGTSGYKAWFAQRPIGLSCLCNLRRGDTLIVTAIDRLGRSFIDQYTSMQVLFDCGVRIIILKGWSGHALDLKKPTDRIMLAILAWAADLEAERLSERTKEGLAYRMANGLSAGKRLFTDIQAFSADVNEIPLSEYNKLAGHFKRNLPDSQWLDQVLELLLLQRTIKLRGNAMYDFCEERGFVTRSRWQWWNGTVYVNKKGIPFRSAIQLLLKDAQLPGGAGQAAGRVQRERAGDHRRHAGHAGAEVQAEAARQRQDRAAGRLNTKGLAEELCHRLRARALTTPATSRRLRSLGLPPELSRKMVLCWDYRNTYEF